MVGMMLAIFRDERVYEGNERSLNAVYPMPSLSKVVVDQDPIKQPGREILGNPNPITPPLFREDSFDPTTRIRRGRFYVVDGQNKKQWRREWVNDYPYARPPGLQLPTYEMDAYSWLQPTLVPAARRPLIFLGDASHNTAWHIVGVERLFNGETLFTLKSANTLGILPDLHEDALPPEKCQQVSEGFERVADAAQKYMPVPIVDVCREFARITLAAWLPTVGGNPEGDLGALIKAVPDDRVGIKSAARIINRLHARGKSSEQERQTQRGCDIRDVSDEDGALSVSLIGFLLREFGWGT